MPESTRMGLIAALENVTQYIDFLENELAVYEDVESCEGGFVTWDEMNKFMDALRAAKLALPPTVPVKRKSK